MKRPYERFAIVYRETPDVIWILAVWAGARNPTELETR